MDNDMNSDVLPTKRSSAKEDRDYLLDYKSVDLSALGGTEILGVSLNNVTRDEAVAVILNWLETGGGPRLVSFLDPVKLMRLRPRAKYGALATESDLALADGAGLEWAASLLHKEIKERIPMMALLMDVVRLAEKMELTIYLLGMSMENVEQAFLNIQRSFPGVRIIGRQGGITGPERERLVKESLRKSSPAIVFLGMGFPRQEQWYKDNKAIFNKAVVFGVDESLDILSGNEKIAPDWMQLKGLAWLWRVLTNPLAAGDFFRTLKFLILVRFHAFRTRKKAPGIQAET